MDCAWYSIMSVQVMQQVMAWFETNCHNCYTKKDSVCRLLIIPIVMWC